MTAPCARCDGRGYHEGAASRFPCEPCKGRGILTRPAERPLLDRRAAPAAPCGDGDSQWYAVQIRPSQAQVRRREYGSDPLLLPFKVEDELLKRGFEAFVPRRAVYRLKNRYSKEKAARVFPLLTGWVFVGWPAGETRWRDLSDTPGVVAVAGSAGVPRAIPAARIAQLRHRWTDGTIKAHEREKFMRSRKEYAPGDTVRIDGGPFDQSVCRVVEIRGSEARVLLTLFGASREVAVDAMQLEHE